MVMVFVAKMCVHCSGDMTESQITNLGFFILRGPFEIGKRI